MSFEVALSGRLLGDIIIRERVGGRVDWMRRPGRALPAVTLQTISDPRPQHLKGFDRVRATRVQVDVWAARPGDAVTLRDQVIALLTPATEIDGVRFQRAAVPNVRSGFEQDDSVSDGQPQGELYRESIDFIFNHNAK